MLAQTLFRLAGEHSLLSVAVCVLCVCLRQYVIMLQNHSTQLKLSLEGTMHSDLCNFLSSTTAVQIGELLTPPH